MVAEPRSRRNRPNEGKQRLVRAVDEEDLLHEHVAAAADAREREVALRANFICPPGVGRAVPPHLNCDCRMYSNAGSLHLASAD